MQGYERLNNENTQESNTPNEAYSYPSFEQHMQELATREKNEAAPNDTESALANNPYSPYLNYETTLKENNEKFGESFVKLNESIYDEYDKASENALRSSSEYWKYRSILNVYGTDKESGTRHYYIQENDGNTREIVTPLRIDVGLDGKVTNRDEFEPESLEIYENLRTKETEAYVESSMNKQEEMKSLIQLNILNNGFANHGTENATIDTRNDLVQDIIRDELSLDGDKAVIPPNTNGELTLTEYINSVAESYDDMANEAMANFEEFQGKFDKVSDAYLHSKNPIKSLLARRKYHQMRTQYNSRLKELETINLYRSAADNLQQRLEHQS